MPIRFPPIESRISFSTEAGLRAISLGRAFELVERLRALERNIGGANMVVSAIQEHASLGEEASPIRLSPGQAAALVDAVLAWPGEVPEEVDLLGQALVPELH